MKQRYLKRFSLVLTLILLITAFAGCGQNPSSSGEESRIPSPITNQENPVLESQGSKIINISSGD